MNTVLFLYAADALVEGGGSDIRVRELYSRMSTVSASILMVAATERADIVIAPNPVDRLRYALRGVPPRISQLADKSVAAELSRDIAAADVIIANTVFSIPYIPRKYYRKVILDAHNLESRVVAQLRITDPSPLRRFAYSATYRWTRRYEESVARQVAAVWAVSSEEAAWFRNAGAKRVAIIPNGATLKNVLPGIRDTEEDLLFVGSLNARFNRDGVEWFATCVWPKVLARRPNARFIVVGSGGAFLNRYDGVKPLGFVDDLTDAYDTSRAAVIPIRDGAGTRLKALEAFAYNVPVVSTTKGVGGLDVENGRDLLIADDAESFADACVVLLTDKGLRYRLADSARARLRRDYDWSVIAQRARDSVQQVANTIVDKTDSERRRNLSTEDGSARPNGRPAVSSPNTEGSDDRNAY